MERINNPLIRQYAVVIAANLCVISVGMGIAWSSPVLVKLTSGTENVLQKPLTMEEGSWMVSIAFLTGIIGNFIPALIVDRVGRKFVLVLGSAPRIGICLMLIFAKKSWVILFARALLGISDSILFTVVTMYASEIASKEVRGALGTILQIFCSIGILTMLSMGPFVSYVTLNVIFTCVTVIATLPLFLLPDSPYFLHRKGRTAELTKVLTLLRGSEANAKEEIAEYTLTNKCDTSEKTRLYKNKVFLKSFCIVVLIGGFGQFVGFNFIAFYLQTILDSTHTNVSSEVASAIIGLIQLMASICSTFMTDRFGRKPILSATLVGSSIGVICLGAFFKLQENESPITGLMNYLPIASIILVVFCQSSGLGSLFWIIVPELLDDRGRSVGVPASIITASFCSFLLTKYIPLLSTTIGRAAVYWIFGVNCIILCLFVIFCLPETKGKSFAEIQEALGARSKIEDPKTEEKSNNECV